MSDVQDSVEQADGIIDTAAEYQRFRLLFKSSSEHKLVALTRQVLNEHGITGFFVFEPDAPASFLRSIGTLPDSFIRGVKENGFQNADQVLRHLTADPRNLPKPLFRSVVDNHVRTAPYSPKAFDRHRVFESYLKSFCIQEVYYHPFRWSLLNTAAVFCLYGTGDPEKFRNSVESFSPRIDALAKAFCESGSFKKLSRNRVKNLNLANPAPVALIRLMAEKDLDGREVAAYKKLHEVTVYKHIAAAKEALGATSPAGLVAQCLKQGYFTIDDIC